MGVKVTGQFEPAGEFPIVDAKDVSGNITGSFISASQVTLGDSNFTGNMTASGDFKIQGSISGSVTSTGSFGRLEIAGDSSILGDVTIGGNINIGDSDTDSLTISADLTSNLIPNADSTFNLGSPTKNWKEGYIEELSSTNITASGDISGSGISTGSLAYLSVDNKIGIGIKSPKNSLHISATDGIIIPVGNTSQRTSDAVAGEIRFNSQQNTYEGYDGANWGTLGGVVDVDQDTKITAENSAGDDNDQLRFFTSGIERLRISSDGHISASGNITASGNIVGTNLVADSSSFSARITAITSSISALKTDSGSFSLRNTNLETTSSALINNFDQVQSLGKTDSVDFNNITTTGNVSGSMSSTGSFGRVVTTDLLVSGESTLKNKVILKHDSSNAILELRSTGGSRINEYQNFNASQIYNSLFFDANAGITVQDGTYSGGNTRARIFSIGHIDGTIYHQFGNENQSAKQTGMGIINYDTISGSAVSTGSFGYLTVDGMSNPNLIEFSSSISSMRTTDSSSISSRLTTEEANIDALQVDSGSFSDRLTNPSIVTLTASNDVHFQQDLKVDGTVTAQEFHTEIVSSSIIFTSGSTRFGNTSDDTHEMTGSLALKGNEIFFGTSSSDRTNLTLKGDQARIQYRHYTNNELYTYLNLSSAGSTFNTSFASDVNELLVIKSNETKKWKFTNIMLSGSSQTTASFHHIHGASKLGVGTLNPLSTVHISASDGLIIPVGNTSQRSSNPIRGEIRFNTSQQTYEGYDGNNWGSLGGMNDVDQDTKITAETSAGADNDELQFFTAGTERLRILADGHISASGNITASKNLQVDGDVTTSVTSTGSFGLVKENGLDLSERFSRNTHEAFELDENGDFQPSPSTGYLIDPKWELDEDGNLQRRERELWTFDWDSYFSD